MRKVICEVSDSGGVDVKIEGGHINKRELLRLLRAVKLAHRASVRLYRQKQMAIRQKEGQKVDAEAAEARVEELKSAEEAKPEVIKSVDVGDAKDDFRITQ